MEDLQTQLDELKKKVNDNYILFINHQHQDFDKSPKLNSKRYIGYVTSGGAKGTPFPDNWLLSKTSTGVYQISHNLGFTNYVVLAIPFSATPAADLTWAVLSGRSAKSCTITFVSSTGTLINSDFNFVLYTT